MLKGIWEMYLKMRLDINALHFVKYMYVYIHMDSGGFNKLHTAAGIAFKDKFSKDFTWKS